MKYFTEPLTVRTPGFHTHRSHCIASLVPFFTNPQHWLHAIALRGSRCEEQCPIFEDDIVWSRRAASSPMESNTLIEDFVSL
jgi:hypothetical protein